MTVVLHSRDDGPTLDEWDEQLRCAQMLDARVVTNLHSLCVSDKLGVADWDFTESVIKRAEQYGVQLCVENGHPDVLLELGEKFETVRYCFDTGHARLSENHTFRQIVDVLSPKTTYLHLTDNYGRIHDP